MFIEFDKWDNEWYRVFIGRYIDPNTFEPVNYYRVSNELKRTHIIEKLTEQFNNAVIIQKADKDQNLRFKFANIEDEAFFLVWSSEGIEI